MVFVKFHNMKQEKKSNVFKLKQTHKFSLYNKSKQYYNHSSQMFSFLFFFFPIYVLSIFLKKCSFFSFFFYMLCSTVFNFLSFLPCPFSIVLHLFFPFFFFFFLINCSFTVFLFFFTNLISASLCLYFNTITIGSFPRLFNFNPYSHKISQVYC